MQTRVPQSQGSMQRPELLVAKRMPRRSWITLHKKTSKIWREFPCFFSFFADCRKKANFKSIPESKTKLHYAIVQGPTGREEWKPSRGICRNVEDFEQILIDLVALKCLLRRDIFLDYDQLPAY